MDIKQTQDELNRSQPPSASASSSVCQRNTVPLNKEIMVSCERIVHFEMSMMPMKHSSRSARKAIGKKMTKDGDLHLFKRY